MNTTTANNLVEKRENLMRTLSNRIEVHYNSRKAAQDKLHEICEELRKQIDEFENKISNELEDNFNKEDNCLQDVLNDLGDIDMDKLNDNNEINKLQQTIQKAKAELLVMQSYDIIECETKRQENYICINSDYDEDGDPVLKKIKIESETGFTFDFTKMWELKVDNEIVLETLELRKPKDVKVINIKNKNISIQITNLNPDETRVLSQHGVEDPLKYKCLLRKKTNIGNDDAQDYKEYILDKMEGCFAFTPDSFETGTVYAIKVKAILWGKESEWSDDIDFRTPEFSEYCVWKEWPSYVEKKYKYSVDENNPRIATKISDECYSCTTIGNRLIPINKEVSWNIKILKSRDDNGEDIYIGVAPFDINQYGHDNYCECGWYFNCYKSTLCSGPPHNYEHKTYGPRKEEGKYVHIGDRVGVVMDTAKGELSFVLNGVNLGVAYEGIPLDKPFVPCVLLGNNGDSVELDTTEVKETEVNPSIPVPSNIITKSNTWNSITLTWNAVEGAEFYQVEVDGRKSWSTPKSNVFTVTRLSPYSEHNFKVRTVVNSKVSEWSDAVKGRTVEESFESCGWKECPDYVVDKNRKYSVDEKNPRIATNISNWGYSTVIGNTTLPPNKVTSWNIRILKSRNNDGRGIYIGVAPFDTDQNSNENYINCGWYFDCYHSTLYSGLPHKHRSKKYGPRKKDGQYAHTGDTIGVMMDTTKGDLSFVVNGVNCGVAYKGIPRDKLLVPCVLLYNYGDSVELNISEIKKANVNSSIPTPSNFTAKSGLTWDSITLTWNAVEGASFYQIEVDGGKSWSTTTTTNYFTKRGFLPDSKHNFRVRAVKNNAVGKWSNIVKGKTARESFESSGWKECSDDADNWNKYFIDENNPRIAVMNEDGCCTIIWNASLPLNKVTSWSIKILESSCNAEYTYIGVAPFGIDQNYEFNHISRGWYFDCYYSTLCSGPPHNYYDKKYGPRKEDGDYVQTGDRVGVAMDTIKGDLSFVLNGINCGVAFEGLPLDKPLVPCIILSNEGDSVGIDI